jgi:perosamine synthetase
MRRWWEPVVGAREAERLAAVVASGYLNDGDVTAELERRIAALCDVPHAVATTSGTSALFLALAAAGIGPGDEVLVPDLTFIATASAVVLAGATPVLVDVEERTLGMDPRAAGEAVTPRTRAMIPVHVSGRSADLPGLLAVARRFDLVVVEDAAEALGSRNHGAALGAHGHLGCFSFSPNKTLTTGQGGMVITRDARAERRLRELKDQGRATRGTGGDDVHASVGFNFKLTNLQAAVGLAQLEELPARLLHQRRLYELYRARLRVLPFADGEVPQWVEAIFDDGAARDAAHDRLLAAGWETRKLWHPLHTQAPYRADGRRFPVASRLSPRLLWLPSSLGMTDDDVARVCDVLDGA